MYKYYYDFGDDYNCCDFELEVSKCDVAEMLITMYEDLRDRGNLKLAIKNILENIDFDRYLEKNGDVPCTIDEYLEEVWDGTFKGFLENFDIDFIEEQLHDELRTYFSTKAAEEYKIK